MHYMLPQSFLFILILYKNTEQFDILYFKTLLLHILEYPSYFFHYENKEKT